MTREQQLKYDQFSLKALRHYVDPRLADTLPEYARRLEIHWRAFLHKAQSLDLSDAEWEVLLNQMKIHWLWISSDPTFRDENLKNCLAIVRQLPCKCLGIAELPPEPLTKAVLNFAREERE